MNPGIPEEAGQTARSLVDALKMSPALLAVIVMQAVTIGLMAWTFHERNAYESGVNKILVEMCHSRTSYPGDGPRKSME